MRLVPVTEFVKSDEIECPFCSLEPKCERIEVQYDKRYYQLPNHRAVGVRQAAKIDWSSPL